MSTRLLAMGVCDSIAHLTGTAPRPNQLRLRLVAACVGYVLALLLAFAILAHFGARA